MKYRDKNVRDLPDFIKKLETDIPNDIGPIWYRGQSDAKWDLKPSLSRFRNPPSEMTLIKRFKQNADLLINKQVKDNIAWLFLMQHYGVPTRLLDWTESPLVALYFAVNSKKNVNKDGALWLLLPNELNKNANIESEESFYIPSFEDEVLQNYNPESLDREKKTVLSPIAAIATRNSQRMQAQLGVFTINHRGDTAINNIGDKKHIWRYIVPKECKSKILSELKLCCIGTFQLFPELNSIGEIIRGDL